LASLVTQPPVGGRRRGLRAFRVALVPLVAVLFAAGCAAPRDDDLFGMELEVHTAQPWASDPALRRRVHDLVQAACDHVGLDPSFLWGMTLRIEDGGISCGPVSDARGCTWREAGVVAVSTLAWTTAEPPVPCVEDTPIPHELLHVKIGDPEHRDPRWADATYWRALSSHVERDGCSGDPAYLLW
jgi:hypothetical protein